MFKKFFTNYDFGENTEKEEEMKGITSIALVMVVLVFTAHALAEEKFHLLSKTELQLHAEFDRQPVEVGLLTLTAEHFSKFSHGDIYIFLDIMGKEGMKTEAEMMYFEIHPRVSLDKILGKRVLPFSFIKETYIGLQYNDSDQKKINRSFLYGLSVDLDLLPNDGILKLSAYARDIKTLDLTYQLTVAWSQPFKVVGVDLVFAGFLDYWNNDDLHRVITEPQLRLPLSNLSNHPILRHLNLGTEVEVTHDFFGKSGWVINPTIFFAISY